MAWASGDEARWGAPVALALSIGALVTYVLWWTRGFWSANSLDNLPGLFSYPSAFIGDLVLLPIAAGMLTALCRTLRANPAVHRSGRIATVIGLLIGISVQTLWLCDDKPALNWTLPVPHTFNLAGWWHAVYFTALCSIFSALFVTAICSLKERMDDRTVASIVAGPASAITFGCLFGYGLLAIHDSGEGRLSGWSSIIALVATALFVLGMGAVLLRKADWTLRWPISRGAALALLFYISVVVISRACGEVGNGWALGIACTTLISIAVAVLLCFPASGSLYRSARGLWHMVLTASALALATSICWNWIATYVQHNSLLVGILLFIVLFLVNPTLLGLLGVPWSWTRQRLATMAALWGLALIALVAAAPDWGRIVGPASGDLVVVLVIGLLTGVCFSPIKKLMWDLLHVHDSDAAHDPTKKYKDTINLAFLLLTAFAAVAALISMAYATSLARGMRSASGVMPNFWWLVFVGLLLTCLAAAGVRSPSLSVVILYAWPLALVILTHPGPLRESSGSLGTFGAILAILTGIAAAIYGLWTADSILFNVVLLRAANLDVRAAAVTVGAVLSSVVAGYVATTTALGQGLSEPYEFPWGFAAAALILILNASLCVFIASVTAPAPMRHTDDDAVLTLKYLAQDGYLFAVLYLVAVVFPIQAAIYSLSTGSWERFTTSFAVASPLLTFFVVVFLETIKINRAHADNEIAKRVSDKSSQRTSDEVANKISGTVRKNRAIAARIASAYRSLRQAPRNRLDEADHVIALHTHCENQNMLAYALAIASLSGAIILLGERE